MAYLVNRDCGAIAFCHRDKFKVIRAAQACDPHTRSIGVNAKGSFGERDHPATALSVRRLKTVQIRANGGACACIPNTKNTKGYAQGRIGDCRDGKEVVAMPVQEATHAIAAVPENTSDRPFKRQTTRIVPGSRWQVRIEGPSSQS